MFPDIKEIGVRSESNQVVGMVLKCREKLICERTKISNWLRGQLYELGEIASLGGSEKILPVSLSFIEKSKDSQKSWIDMYELIHTCIQKVITSINDQIDWAIAADENCKGYEESKTSLIYKIRTGAIEQIDHSDNELLN